MDMTIEPFTEGRNLIIFAAVVWLQLRVGSLSVVLGEGYTTCSSTRILNQATLVCLLLPNQDSTGNSFFQ
jgi:hypothetical protein